MATFATPLVVDMISHQAVTHPDTVVGTTRNVTGLLACRIYMYHGMVEAAANTNPGSFLVQTAHGDTDSDNEHWATEATYTANNTTPDTEAMTASEPAGERTLAVASTTNFVAGDVLYIQDTGTLANSEWARCREIVTNTSIDLIDGLTNAKDSADVIWNDADVFVYAAYLDAVNRIRVVFQHEGSTGANVHIKAVMSVARSVI